MRNKSENKVEWKGMPSSEAELKMIKAAVESTYSEYQAIATAKDGIKDIFEDIHAKTGIPRRVFNFLSRTNYTGNAYETINKNTALQEAYEAIERTSL